jgi:uncharacterized protein (UPF0332 family)
MDGRDFLRVARTLALSRDEADIRSAVSRAYYAAFHAARVLLKALGFVVPRADRAHEYLYRRLNNCGHGPAADAGRALHALRQLRNKADYDVEMPLPVPAGSAVADADSVFQTLDALTPAERVQITVAMKLYEQGIGDVTWHP